MFFPIEITDQIVTYSAEGSKGAGWFKKGCMSQRTKTWKSFEVPTQKHKAESTVAAGGGGDVHTGAA